MGAVGEAGVGVETVGTLGAVLAGGGAVHDCLSAVRVVGHDLVVRRRNDFAWGRREEEGIGDKGRKV